MMNKKKTSSPVQFGNSTNYEPGSSNEPITEDNILVRPPNTYRATPKVPDIRGISLAHVEIQEHPNASNKLLFKACTLGL